MTGEAEDLLCAEGMTGALDEAAVSSGVSGVAGAAARSCGNRETRHAAISCADSGLGRG
ncbi:hypothetical protein [Anaerobiospirillum sp. NML120449]|uniref:hypothetical protein n=1 Tax=Anaerobiospirillum sp. NML120449 TaxID=2932817 RepID=UPI001FF35719|nr:hypothetical protein [Anaerobiospirillum sp. NML120449]MCK0525370.1 hypothetical protein [Anaerobiospirillum sp. NML120449]